MDSNTNIVDLVIRTKKGSDPTVTKTFPGIADSLVAADMYSAYLELVDHDDSSAELIIHVPVEGD